MRLFIAVWPPPAVVEVLHQLPRPDCPDVRWTLPQQWHVTLRFLGETEVVPALSGDLPPAEAVLGPTIRRINRQVLVAPVAGLEDIAAAVGNERPFAGHLTMARAKGRRTVPPELSGTPLAGRWKVEEVTVVRSHLGRGPARYEVLERTPVRR